MQHFVQHRPFAASGLQIEIIAALVAVAEGWMTRPLWAERRAQ
jgi:hypothetical protein